jgi:hypothetical protein
MRRTLSALLADITSIYASKKRGFCWLCLRAALLAMRFCWRCLGCARGGESFLL